MSKLILGAEVYSVVNAALEVLSKLGHGFHEKPYENALVAELGLRGMSCLREVPLLRPQSANNRDVST